MSGSSTCATNCGTSSAARGIPPPVGFILSINSRRNCCCWRIKCYCICSMVWRKVCAVSGVPVPTGHSSCEEAGTPHRSTPLQKVLGECAAWSLPTLTNFSILASKARHGITSLTTLVGHLQRRIRTTGIRLTAPTNAACAANPTSEKSL